MFRPFGAGGGAQKVIPLMVGGGGCKQFLYRDFSILQPPSPLLLTGPLAPNRKVVFSPQTPGK